jgi:hypothetical protein
VFIKNSLTAFSYSQNGAPAVGFQQLSSNGESTSVGVVTATPAQTPYTTGRRPTGAFTLSSPLSSPTTSSGAAEHKVGATGWPGLGIVVGGMVMGVMAVL